MHAASDASTQLIAFCHTSGMAVTLDDHAIQHKTTNFFNG